MDEIRGYCQQARQLREQEAELQRSGRTDFRLERRFSSCKQSGAIQIHLEN